MPDTVAMILAGGHVEGYGILTRYRPKGALPFGGFYRLIDFALSNLSNSAISHAGLIVQYQPASMIEHVGVGEWWDMHGIGRLLKILPPYTGPRSTDWFSGTADALYQNLNFIEDLKPDNVIILSGEHKYRMDYRPLLAAHQANDADVTLVCKNMPPERCTRRFGYARLGDDNEIVEYYEKPDIPPTTTISMGIYVFRRSILVDWLERNARSGTGRNLALDVMPFLVEANHVHGYLFEDEWNYLGDIDAYFAEHERMLEPDRPLDLIEWEVMTNMNDRALSQRVSARVGEGATAQRSLLSPGCEIEGVVRGSVLSPGVIVERGAVVEDAILMHDTKVRRGARLRRVVSDKDVDFGAGCRVGSVEAESDGHAPLCILGKGVEIDANAAVGPGAVIDRDRDGNSRPVPRPRRKGEQ